MIIMESAIPPRLEVKRTRHRRVPDDYQPPYPAFVARHQPAVERVVMAYFGLQYRGDPPPARAAALDWIEKSFATAGGPKHWDRAEYVDEARYTNVVSVAYWDDQKAFEAWFSSAREGWTGAKNNFAGLGLFVEVVSPSINDYETLFSSLGRPEGIAVLADSLSGDVMEHAYWGAMRDRIPKSQTNDMAPAGDPSLVRDGDRVRVKPQDNICLIRSGQDWSDTEASERKMYLEDVEPVLRAGMDFLRDEGRSVGCFANRYMTVLDRDGRPTEKSYGMSWWKSLAALERWSESHPTHVRIFGAAMKYLSLLGPAAKLRLYHEVTVAHAADQFFEYRNCHGRTGMLNAAAEGAAQSAVLA
jgi:aldoxime dehydratase